MGSGYHNTFNLMIVVLPLIGGLAAFLGGLLWKLSKVVHRVDENEKDIDGLGKKLVEVRDACKADNRQYSQSMLDVCKQVAELQSSQTSLIKMIEQMQIRQATLEEYNRDLDKRWADRRAELDGKTNSLQVSIAETGAGMKSIQREITDLKNSFNRFETEVRKLIREG